jgi:hypothetical protein
LLTNVDIVTAIAESGGSEILRNPVVKAEIAAALAKTASQILGNLGVKAGQDHNRGGPVARASACRLLLSVVVQAVHACRRPGRQ